MNVIRRLLPLPTPKINDCFLLFPAELGDYDELEHTPELVSEFRFVPFQTEEMEMEIVEKFKEMK